MESTITVTMDEAKDLIAVFEPAVERVELTADAEGNGEIEITSESGENDGTYQEIHWNVAKGEQVKMTAKPDSGWKFKEWKNKTTGETYSTDKTISVTADEAFELTAVFVEDKDPGKVVMTGAKSDSNGKLTASWEKDENADGYEVLIWNSRRMGFRTSVSRFNVDGSETEVTVDGLNPNGRCYVRVRAYKLVNGRRVYGRYSSTSSVTVKGYDRCFGTSYGYDHGYGYGFGYAPFTYYDPWGYGYRANYGRPYMMPSYSGNMISPFYFFRF